jgi:hypothetical protein
MTIISQTPAKDNGDYTITFINDKGDTVTKTLNLFNF